LAVIVKHQGKKYEVDLDPTSLGETFKYQLFSLTGVEPERQKILVKGGQLKDDTDLSKLGAKPGQTFMMMGTPLGAGVLQRPKEAIKFVEDMTEAEAAQQVGQLYRCSHSRWRRPIWLRGPRYVRTGRLRSLDGFDSSSSGSVYTDGKNPRRIPAIGLPQRLTYRISPFR
jgi:hypothetical protein